MRSQNLFITCFLSCFLFLSSAYADPSAFSLISPEDGASVLTEVLLDWEDSTDPDGGLTYTILLSKGNDSFNDPIRFEGIRNSCRVLGESASIEDQSTYYWKVRAINKYGNTFDTEPWVFETDNNANPVVAWIGGHVYSSFQQIPIPNIEIIVPQLWSKDFTFRTDMDGNFCGELDPEKPMNPGTEEEITIKINAVGCLSKTVSKTIILGEFTDIESISLEFDGIGDMDGNGYHDLKDAVSVLQILAGMKPSVINNQGFPNEDSKIGLSELIYILQRILDPSPCSQNPVLK